MTKNKTVTMSQDAAKVLADTFKHALDNGKQPTFSAGDLRFFIDQLTIIAAPVVERQPVAQRAAFEREVQSKAERLQPDYRRYGEHPDAEYKDATLQWAYELWLTTAITSPPAPVAVEVDERAEFEAWAIKSFGLREGHLVKEDGEYANYPTQCYFDVWKARACLDKVKELNQ